MDRHHLKDQGVGPYSRIKMDLRLWRCKVNKDSSGQNPMVEFCDSSDEFFT